MVHLIASSLLGKCDGATGATTTAVGCAVLVAGAGAVVGIGIGASSFSSAAAVGVCFGLLESGTCVGLVVAAAEGTR